MCLPVGVQSKKELVVLPMILSCDLRCCLLKLEHILLLLTL